MCQVTYQNGYFALFLIIESFMRVKNHKTSLDKTFTNEQIEKNLARINFLQLKKLGKFRESMKVINKRRVLTTLYFRYDFS